MNVRPFALASAIPLACAAFAVPASAEIGALVQPGELIDASPGGFTLVQPTWKCRRWDLGPCTSVDLANPYYRQIVVLPTGYMSSEHAAFWTDFDTLVTQMSNTGSVWSTQKRDRILYVGYFTGGGALGSPDAAFRGAVLAHPIRDYALSLSNGAVAQTIDQIKANAIFALKPLGVMVLFNTFQSDISANASTPGFDGRSFGVAKMTRDDLKSGYIGTHELGHAALNFVDEYVEEGLENQNIRSFDVATPLVRFDGSWSAAFLALGDPFGVYDYNISEILADNGHGNVSTSSVPSTVSSPISAPQQYSYEGGLFFGRGVYHAAGKNLMNSGQFNAAEQNGFAYAHSGPQQMTIDTAFGDAAYRANDRLRTAGPKNGWPLELGGTTVVLMRDADKHHQFHRTQSYKVQTGWWERVWNTCWSGTFPYPCYTSVWKTAQKTVYPGERRVQVQAASLYGLANLFQSVMCGVGVTEATKPDGSQSPLCEQPLSESANAFLPTFTFRTPYQETTVPANQWFTTYWWRFASHNGTTWSGYTGWSSFYRSF